LDFWFENKPSGNPAPKWLLCAKEKKLRPVLGIPKLEHMRFNECGLFYQ
jgi:hypothetical protein